ncbi:OsmC family protein [Adhaeribacter soli]|uniref:OsmC family protein n=1 Tax=Adhaeribacter soli TaxID=2607655 RepID=UPI001CDA09EE|nr:OsmC family protein [Adhaeribacter soli]
MEKLASCDIEPCDVTVQVGPRALKAKVRSGNHTFVVDEPVNLGGEDTGPHPYDLILSALGSCTAITLRMYANRKQWPLEKIETRLQYFTREKTFATEADFKEIQEIIMLVKLSGNLSEEQVQRLTVIAGKCPVHQSLLPAFPITMKVEMAAPDFQ